MDRDFQAWVLEQVQEAVITADTNLVILSWNHGAEEVYGWTRAEAVGKLLPDVLQTEFPDLSRDVILERVVRQGVFKGEVLQRHRNGNRLVVEVTIAPIRDGSGGICGYVEVTRNLTEQNRMYRLLQDALACQKKLTDIINNSPVLVVRWRMDPHCPVEFVSENVGRLLGHEAKELVSGQVSWEDLLDPGNRARQMEAVEEHIRAGHAEFSMRYLLRRSSGGSRWMEGPTQVLRNSSGTVSHCQCTLVDVTEQVWMEEALRNSEERLRRIFDTTAEGIWVIDPEGKTVLVNQTMATLLGCADPQEMIGASLLEFVPDDWKELVWSTVPRTPDHIFQKDLPLCRKDKCLVWIHVSAVAMFEADGRYGGAMAMISDISERRRVEEALAANQKFLQDILDAIQDGITVLSRDLTILRTNRTMEAWYAHAGPLAGRRCFEAYHHREGPCPGCPTRLTLQDGQPHTETLSYVDKDGRPGWMELFAFPMRDQAGQMTGVVEFARDITARKRAEDNLQQLQERIWQIQKRESLSVMAGGIAHHFNNMLMIILGNAELLLGDTDPASANHPLLTSIRDAASRAADVSRQILTFSGHSFARKERLSLNKWIRDRATVISSVVGPTAEAVYKLDTEAPDVEADPEQLHQILLSLLSNAVEAIGAGSGTITISTGTAVLKRSDFERNGFREGGASGEYSWFAVQDDGCGMDEKTLAHIFEPFFSTKFAGRGLGLAAISGIVRSHGGAIAVESSLHHGTVVRVYLPSQEPEEPVPALEPAVLAPPAATACILVVDDEADIRRLFRHFLEREGHTVLEAANGAAAESVLRREGGRIDLVILDLKMEGTSGDQVFGWMQAECPRIPVLFCSGYGEEEVSLSLTGNRPFEYIHKPLDENELVEKVRGILARKK